MAMGIQQQQHQGSPPITIQTTTLRVSPERPGETAGIDDLVRLRSTTTLASPPSAEEAVKPRGHLIQTLPCMTLYSRRHRINR
ncbi:uncharacterized protein ColSpa_07920 [Colletotrichum spaethianum]|uniref:Uncharacterized protein n=1 Tax=Colletotrichum spaethianum TaxID=700344 RepID=A0AA37P8S2_9PEZI|nr:uncharacterized protein ColSpa_07920 [Colletotrichum spaethianum]GKT47739.1 hypothetical protein ColSpa_07920 [Colletotrichum spaethianum]